MHLDIKREVSQWLTSRSFCAPRTALARGAEPSESEGMQPLSGGQSKARSGSGQSPRVERGEEKKGRGKAQERVGEIFRTFASSDGAYPQPRLYILRNTMPDGDEAPSPYVLHLFTFITHYIYEYQ